MTLWVLATQSSWPARSLLCPHYLDEKTEALRGWEIYLFSIKKNILGNQNPDLSNPKAQIFFSIPHLELPKEASMICAILLSIWSLKDPLLKCMKGGHSRQITVLLIPSPGSRKETPNGSNFRQRGTRERGCHVKGDRASPEDKTF